MGGQANLVQAARHVQNIGWPSGQSLRADRASVCIGPLELFCHGQQILSGDLQQPGQPGPDGVEQGRAPGARVV